MGLKFESDEAEDWLQFLENYPERLRGLNNEKLTLLDDFYREDLPSAISSRGTPHITRDDLVKVMDWKLTRGKWRPRLLAFVSAIDEQEVIDVSQEAFSCLPDLKAAVETLSKLKGVGPATASAILAAVDPENAPFMSDEALHAALGSSKDYTLKYYLAFVDKLKSKASGLNGKQNKIHLSASDLERALWSAAAENFPPKKGKPMKKIGDAATCAKRKSTSVATKQSPKKGKR